MTSGELSGDQNAESPVDPVQKMFKARFEELAAIRRLNNVRAQKSIEDISKVWIGMNGEDKERIIGFGQTMDAVSRAKADTEWVVSLVNAGIPKKQILEIWDVKDGLSRGKQGETQQPASKDK